MKQATKGSREVPEMLAIQALAFIAEEPERLAHFLEITGIPHEQIRAAADEPGFLAGVLDHMLADENLLIAFADRGGFDPAAIARARTALGRLWERDTP